MAELGANLGWTSSAETPPKGIFKKNERPFNHLHFRQLAASYKQTMPDLERIVLYYIR
jgi:hypothetical protein